ncbi:Glycosyltransferase involved in cell wall bisynthesis [Lutibacter agarilyticus]|uniref:Glycosyltransferase involved in cell wall bisynthesis n=1 Tax=Lutibacter agarilyticus TaxID=1109740 RepID=A0A238WTZ1_9FLAO|nr:glycosyltransferase [Lutibacter agarilyticus]SNR49898.1 Glycosyltransferase involved in cell wall bisynthesis [Lutibacter agarilyticus]
MDSNINTSIIIPCFNAEDFLERAVESVFIQKLSNFEIILIDNNSKDNTISIINQLVGKHPKIITSIVESKPGAPYARNAGLNLAKGKYIQFLDADDVLFEGKIKRQIELIEQYSSHVVLGSFLKTKGDKYKKFKVNVCNDFWKSFVSSNLGITSANLYLKTKLEEVNGWTIGLSSSQEYELLFKIIKNGGLFTLDQSFNTVIYEPDNSITRTLSPERTIKLIDDYVFLRIAVKRFLQNKNELNKNLNIYIDKCIYRTLIGRQKNNPSYVNEKISSLNLIVPLYYKLIVRLHNLLKK